jgi:hypothetical protein
LAIKREQRSDLHEQWSDLARGLLTLAPVLVQGSALGNQWTLRSSLAGTGRLGEPAASVDALWQLIDGCVSGDAKAIAAASELLLEAPATFPANPLEKAAAWHAMLNNAHARREPYSILWRDVVKLPVEPFSLFTDLLDRYPPDGNSLLANADVLTCQHLLGSIIPQFKAIQKIVPGVHFWEILGKPYSANIGVVQTLESAGFEVNKDSCMLPVRGTASNCYRLGTFAQRHRQVVRASVKRFFSSMSKTMMDSRVPILVIDDGGVLIDAVGNEAVAAGTTRPIVCIEQTQHGLYAARTYIGRRHTPKGGFAVINVAQSLSKLVLEAPLIAESVLENTIAAVDRLVEDRVVSQGNGLRVGIVGFGSVGESIAETFRDYGTRGELEPHGLSDLIVYDRNKNRIAGAKRANHDIAWSVDHLLKSAQVVIAATGGTSFYEESAKNLNDGAILASASSGDIEFRGLSNWDSDQMPVLPGILENTDFDIVHGDICLSRPEVGQVRVLNGGFPVNFNGDFDPIPSERIQLTRALMLAGVLQASGFDGSSAQIVGKTEEFDLAEDLDYFLSETYQKGSLTSILGPAQSML